MGQWRRLDRGAVQNWPSRLDDDDVCYYARELVSEGYASSPDNSMIWNFKKSVDRRGYAEWRYKEEAIRAFAKELNMVLSSEREIYMAYIPSSKSKTDPQYDSRLEDTIEELKKLNHQVVSCEPIIQNTSMVAAHHGGTRDISALAANYSWQGFPGIPPSVLFVIDDVLTSGAHFKAYKMVVTQHCPQTKVIGMFWALTRQLGSIVDEVFN